MVARSDEEDTIISTPDMFITRIQALTKKTISYVPERIFNNERIVRERLYGIPRYKIIDYGKTGANYDIDYWINFVSSKFFGFNKKPYLGIQIFLKIRNGIIEEGRVVLRCNELIFRHSTYEKEEAALKREEDILGIKFKKDTRILLSHMLSPHLENIANSINSWKNYVENRHVVKSMVKTEGYYRIMPT